MNYNSGDKIEIKTIHRHGLDYQCIEKHGNVYIIVKESDTHLNVVSVLTGERFTLTKKYYEISMVYNYSLPEELFVI